MAASALILDLDGTLWDSRPWLSQLLGGDDVSACERALAALERTPAATMLKRAGVTKAKYRQLCSSRDGLALYPGVARTLRELNARATPIGVVTSLPSWMADPMLERLEVSAALATVVDHGRTRRRKPHPDPLLVALDDLGLDPAKDIWYVGDIDDDCRAALAAGISFAWASYGYARSEPDGATASIRRFAEVLDL